MKSTRVFRPVLLTTFLLFLAAAAGAGSPLETDSVSLTVLATTDLHGALQPSGRDQQKGGAVALASYIARERAANPQGTLLLDAGDSFHGTAIANATEGRAMIDFMSQVGYDAAAVGNHEFNFGVAVLRQRMAQASFPFLSANVVERSTGAAPVWSLPYTVFERQGVRIAVVGLLTVTTPETTLRQNVADFDFVDQAPVVKRLLAELVPARADLVILLAHLDLFLHPDTGAPGGELAELAEQAKGVAAIVGGHSHLSFRGEIAGIPVIEPAARGQQLGRIDLVYDRRARRISSSATRLIDVVADALPPEPAAAALVARYEEESAATLKAVLGQAAAELGRDPEHESTMGNLLTDVVRETIGADVVFQNPLGVRGGLVAGAITFEDLYRVLPFDNTIVLVEMTGAEIRQLLEDATEKIAILYTSGLRYEADLRRPFGSRTTVTSPLEDARKYKVAINNFLAQGGEGLMILANRPEARDTGLLLRDALADWIRARTAEGKPISAALDGRIVRPDAAP